MKIHFFPFSEQPENKWTGGTTRQLAIYPFDSSLAERNFVFRISTATVETETSTFSKFEGYHRQLMILEGELNIEHRGHHSKHLKPFDIDSFEGSWETTAEGKVVDFNVIYSDKVKQVSVQKLEVKAAETQWIRCKSNELKAIYLLSGSIEIENQLLNKCDFILLEDRGILINFKSNCVCILVTIILKE